MPRFNLRYDLPNLSIFSFMYQYRWIPGGLVPSELLNDMAHLYSAQYGIWSKEGPRPGQHVKLSPERIQTEWLSPRHSRVVWATAFGRLIGYAIAVQTHLADHGMVSWVTQLVVDEEHRRSDVGKTLLFTIWQFSDHFAWGLITANPYAVRALEKATRRRCSPAHISARKEMLTSLGTQVVPYVTSATQNIITESESRVNTEFFLDHSALPEMLLSVQGAGKSWSLGALQDGWEWFAFTFREQQQIELSRKEIEQMLLASDAVTKQAYSRMTEEQPWAKYADQEVKFLGENCPIHPRTSVLDFGCGTGRHSIRLAKLGARVLGIDYLECKRLTNTPVRQAGSVLKCPDDRKNRVVSAEATYPCGCSAVGGGVCEQRYAAERVLPESRFEFQHTGSPSKETALEEKAQTSFFGWPVGASGVGCQEIAEAARTEL